MYHKNIRLIFTFLSLFLITNVFGAPGPSVEPNHGELENSLYKTQGHTGTLLFSLNFGKHLELFNMKFTFLDDGRILLINHLCSEPSQWDIKTFTFCQNGKCCSTGSLVAKNKSGYCYRNNYPTGELGECGKFEFASMQGNVTFYDLSSAIDVWKPKDIELFLGKGPFGNGTSGIPGYHNWIKCSFDERIDSNDRNEPSSMDFNCEPKKCLFWDCDGKVSFVLGTYQSNNRMYYL